MIKTELFNTFLEKNKRKEELIFMNDIYEIFSNYDHSIQKWFIQYHIKEVAKWVYSNVIKKRSYVLA